MAKKQWIDENGITIPASRVTKTEKNREKVCDRLVRRAVNMSEKLAEYKAEFAKEVDKVYQDVMREAGIDTAERKGNFTFYNFDRSIKVETDVSERIEFDDAQIAVAKEYFDLFLDNASGGVDAMIRELIMDAFSTSRGRLDTKKVLNLTRYRGRIDANKYPHFHRALDAIEMGIRKPDSKKYHRISIRNKDGEYEAVNLNFSSL